MINFKKLEISDFYEANKIFKQYNIENCDHCFSTMVIWSHRFQVEISIQDGEVFMRTKGDNSFWYLSPTGAMPFEEAVKLIIEDARQNGHNVKIHAMNEEQKDKLQEGFPGQFAIIEDRDSYDYIYKGEDLRLLQGKNYQKKRNHCSRFEKDNPDYTFNIITQENIEKVKQFEKEWCKRNNCDEARGLFAEQQGIMELLNNYEKLDLIGAFIETEQGIVAFTLAAPINDDMVDVIVEKAFHEINGAYAVINRDFAFHCLESYKFINREDDMGEENLRKAKLSYFPFEVREKFLAKLIV